MCEKTARAIIFNNNDLITIKRTKYINNCENIYYTLPGGHVEENESFEETVIREVEEELGIKVGIKKEFISIYNEELERYEKFFICEYISGTLGTGKGPEFTNVDLEKYGNYEIVNISKDKIKKYNLLPRKVKLEICKKIIKNA